ncbi:MAG TPA: DUF4398 domain-containing protein [Polyangiaceae bacterium]|nr:DUF4398 domain-containing protein [Polyangiaceae bacterium]
MLRRPWISGTTLAAERQLGMCTSATLVAIAMTLMACGGAAVPQDKLTAAEAAVRAAEVGGAPDNPQAALHLKYARDQIAEAQKLIEDDENEAAAGLLDRAEVDAELALALARVEGARAEAQAARNEIEELKRRQAGQ